MVGLFVLWTKIGVRKQNSLNKYNFFFFVIINFKPEYLPLWFQCKLNTVVATIFSKSTNYLHQL